jgi:hypothetical protein
MENNVALADQKLSSREQRVNSTLSIAAFYCLRAAKHLAGAGLHDAAGEMDVTHERLLAALEDRSAQSDLEWFGTHMNLELFFYMPTYGDDDDLSEEWRVTSVNGGINDREWTIIGRGKTPAEALAAARKQKGN